MRKFAFFGVGALFFGALPLVDGLPFVLSSLLLVAMGVALACAASGRINAISVASGALAAFASTALRPLAPAVGGALLIAMAFAERSMRVRTATGRLVHIGVGLVGGGLAGQLTASFGAANLAVFAVSVVVAIALSSLPLLLDADDPKAHALEQASEELPEPSRTALREAAELRRHSLDVPLERDAKASVERSWEALLRLSEAKAKLEKTKMRGNSDTLTSVSGMVDEKIQGHLVALRKAFTAADTMKAFASASDDTSLSNMAATGDSLDEVSRVLLDYDIEEKRRVGG